MSVSAWNTNRQLRRSQLKTPPLRLPGQSLEERISELQDTFMQDSIVTVFLILIAGIEWLRWWMPTPSNPFPSTTLAVAAIIYTWRKRLPFVSMIRNLRLGRDGERVVGELLEPLRGKGYRVFHDIPGANFNIDHAIVGPAGIFMIETKTRSKLTGGSHKMFYDGQAIRLEDGRSFQKPLKQARAQAQWLANLLNDGRGTTFTVRPVVVFPEWYVERTGPRSMQDVWVLNPKALGKFLDHEPQVLSTDAINAVSHALTQHCRRPITEGSEE
ncbi:MAG: nuclease-related domain-containing protein [Nitrospirota bacterium]|nr:nuclease-related domain-containing protein [Nitrospirota bacterium]